MNPNISFHEVRFPTDLAIGASGGPIRQTEVITLGSGKEQRNSRWKHSRRRYNAGYGIKTITDLQVVIEFFEERRGRLYGFRFKDPLDYKSSKPGQVITQYDQHIATGDGVSRSFELIKRYGSSETGYKRRIVKPVKDSLILAVNNTLVAANDYSVDWANGVVNFNEDTIPANNAIITAGYEFDLPIRFDADEISINLSHFEAGDIPSIPLVELLI